MIPSLPTDGETLPSEKASTSSENGPRSISLMAPSTHKEGVMNSLAQTPQPSAESPMPPQFPEGGLQAWLTVLGGYDPYLLAISLDL